MASTIVLPRTPDDAAPDRLSLPDRTPVVPGRMGDHPHVHELLLDAFHGPSAAEFQALIDEPAYDPADRLLLRGNGQLIGHVHVSRRMMHFGAALLPVGVVQHLAVAATARGGGRGTQLLREAERRMQSEGSVVGLLATRRTDLFARQGWAVCGRHSFSLAPPRHLLAAFASQQHGARPPLDQHRRPIRVRLWRQVEQDALAALYARAAFGRYGCFQRTAERWRWLVSRQGYDRLYVAIDGPDKFDFLHAAERIVGYAAARGGRIVELICRPDRPTAALELLARICGDALERDEPAIQLDAPRDEPLHEIFRAAGGAVHHHEAVNGQVFMAKVLDPAAMIELLGGELASRAIAAGVRLPCELPLALGGVSGVLAVGPQQAELRGGAAAAAGLELTPAAATRLLLGHEGAAEALARGALRATSARAARLAGTLFPPLPLWLPPLDDLPAR